MMAALANLKPVCNRESHGRYRVELVDLIKYRGLARNDQVVANASFVRGIIEHLRCIIGLSRGEYVLRGKELAKASAT